VRASILYTLPGTFEAEAEQQLLVGGSVLGDLDLLWQDWQVQLTWWANSDADEPEHLFEWGRSLHFGGEEDFWVADDPLFPVDTRLDAGIQATTNYN